MATADISSSVPYTTQSSFAVRLAEAKKAAVEAALKERQESLKAVLIGQSGVKEGVKIDKTPTIPFRLTAPYPQLKSAGKRKRPIGNDDTDCLRSPSEYKRTMNPHTAREQACPPSASANSLRQKINHPVST